MREFFTVCARRSDIIPLPLAGGGLGWGCHVSVQTTLTNNLYTPIPTFPLKGEGACRQIFSCLKKFNLMKTRIALIAAIGPDGSIGSDNKMPWHMPRDLRFFRRVTSGHTVIMGRKTFEAIGSKPLPKRRNIVVTRNTEYKANKSEVVHSLEAALAAAQGEARVFIIGGGELYRQSMDIADEIYLTHIDDLHPNKKLFPLFESDTFFPEVNESDWIVHRQGRQFTASNKLRSKPGGAASGMTMQFVTYKRRPSNKP